MIYDYVSDFEETYLENYFLRKVQNTPFYIIHYLCNKNYIKLRIAFLLDALAPKSLK